MLATRIHLGEAAAVEQEIRRQLPVWQEHLGNNWRLDLGQGILGQALVALERYDEAEPLLVRSFLGLLKQNKQRRKQEGFDRLAEFYNRVDRPQALAQYEALLNQSAAPPAAQ